MKDLQIFNFNGLNDVRTGLNREEVWFVAKDIADSLGYSDTNKMVSRLDDDEFMTAKLAGMNMNSILVNESGLYSCIFGSNKPDAKIFRKWITQDILPTIRRTGKYDISQSQWLEEKQLLEAKILVANDNAVRVVRDCKNTIGFVSSLQCDLDVMLHYKHKVDTLKPKKSKYVYALEHNVHAMDFNKLEEIYQHRLEIEDYKKKVDEIAYRRLNSDTSIPSVIVNNYTV